MSDTKTVSQYEYAVHPLANLFPEITGDEYEKLKADIKAHGQREPIILDEAGEVLLDGRTRLRILKELGITPRIDRFAATPADSEADLIYSRNIMRRHLTADQRAALALRWKDEVENSAKQRQRLHGGTAPGVSKNTSGESAQSVPRTRKVLAQKAGVTEHTMRQAEAVAAHAPELLPQVESGEVSLKDAAATATAKKKSKRPRHDPNIRPAGNRKTRRQMACQCTSEV